MASEAYDDLLDDRALIESVSAPGVLDELRERLAGIENESREIGRGTLAVGDGSYETRRFARRT